MIYFDSAATTLQKPPAVAIAMAEAVNTLASPGRGGYRPAMAAAEAAYNCRAEAGELLGISDPERVVFTLNATHALNIAIRSLVSQGDEVVISGWEHNAVTRPLYALGAKVRVAEAPLFDAEKTLAAFERAITRQTVCVICTHVSNVFGAVQPVEALSALCRERRIPLIVDAAQSAGCLPVDADGWGAAFVAMPGHKGLYGPQGTGLLLCGRNAVPVPLLLGGTGSVSLSRKMPDFLPDRLEAGTHNICGIAGLLEGLRYVRRQGVNAILDHERRLVRAVADGLSGFPGVTVFQGPEGCAQAGVLSFQTAGKDCEVLAEMLGQQGVAVRGGLHCAPLAHRSVGTLEEGTVRLSFSAFNTLEEVERFLEITERLIRRGNR